MPSCPKADNRDPAYFRHCQDLCRDPCWTWEPQCFVCDARDRTIIPHHPKAKRRFGDKSNVIFLCGRCHGEIHHVGKETFCRINGIEVSSLEDKAHRLYTLYLETMGE